MTIETTLQERGKTHGDFTENSAISQRVKSMMRSAENWRRLEDYQREALEMTAHKIGRILAGDPNQTDHWHDIAGYATLVEKALHKSNNVE